MFFNDIYTEEIESLLEIIKNELLKYEIIFDYEFSFDRDGININLW
jgi:hypothetical protein